MLSSSVGHQLYICALTWQLTYLTPGIIKGSEQALSSANGVLERDTYCDMSDRVAAFSGQRDTVYSLFEAYLKTKKKEGQADNADR